MRELRLVALSDDGTHLILRADGEETPMRLPLDERLHAALRGDRARLGQLQVQLDSKLRPREIQAKVRGGESVEAVAAAAGVPLDRVLRFASPVLAERQHVAERARRAVIRRAGGDGHHRPLEEAVAEWVSTFDADPETVIWDAWRRDDGKWQVCASWRVRDDDRRALFTFEPSGRSVLPDDDEARAVAGERKPEPEPEPVPPPAAGGPARLSVVSSVDDAPSAAEEPEPTTGGRPQPADGDADADDPDNQPTVPVPVAARRPARPDSRDARRTGRGREEQPDPWAAEEPAGDRLRLTDIASRVEVDGDDPPDRAVSASVAAPAEKPAARERPARRSSRSKRPPVPSWDEIMFGRRGKPD